MADSEARVADSGTAEGLLSSGALTGMARPIAVGIGAGWLGGTGMFVNTRSTFMPFYDLAGYPLVFVFFAGLFAYLLSPTLKGSFYAIVVTVVVGSAVLLVGLLAPFWILPYEPAVRRVFVIPLTATWATITFTSYPYFLGAGYVTGIVLNRLFDVK